MSTEYFSDDSRQTTTKVVKRLCKGSQRWEVDQLATKRKGESGKEDSCGQKDASSHVKIL